MSTTYTLVSSQDEWDVIKETPSGYSVLEEPIYSFDSAITKALNDLFTLPFTEQEILEYFELMNYSVVMKFNYTEMKNLHQTHPEFFL